MQILLSTGFLFDGPRNRAHRTSAGRLAVASAANENIDVACVYSVGAGHRFGWRYLLHGAAASTIGKFVFAFRQFTLRYQNGCNKNR